MPGFNLALPPDKSALIGQLTQFVVIGQLISKCVGYITPLVQRSGDFQIAGGVSSKESNCDFRVEEKSESFRARL